MSPIVEQLLAQRGITDVEAFLHPVLGGLAQPTELPGIDDAVQVIRAALRARTPVVVFGDYDCDGVSATAILMKTLQALGANVQPFLPDRLAEGYGMSDKSVARMLTENPDVGLVVTVDNGINSVEQTADLKARGIRIIITDHHLPGEELPVADALVNPRVSGPEKLKNLCGAGVAYLLAQALISAARADGSYTGGSIGGPLLVLAGLATVTDIMPLLGQNRILVAEALARFPTWAPVGLRELRTRVARTTNLTSRDFSFLLGPRINAAGRMSSGLEALELLLSDDREISRELARIVDEYNLDRKKVEQEMSNEAEAKIVQGAPAQVIELPNGHPGVAGIVAARILDREGVPVCVFAGGHGSARAPEGFNLRDAFVACSDVLERYGGHAAAGGFSVREGQVDAFREKLCAYCAALPRTNARAEGLRADLWVTPEEITLSLADELEQLEPFGEGNPIPVFGFRDAHFTDARVVGVDGRHLCTTVNHLYKAIWWGHGNLAEALKKNVAVPYDIVFTVEASEYDAERHVELRLVDIKRKDLNT